MKLGRLEWHQGFVLLNATDHRSSSARHAVIRTSAEGGSPRVTARRRRARRPLEVVYRVVLHGGKWLSPAGQLRAGGSGTVRLLGATELCWRLRGLYGVARGMTVELDRGSVTGGVHDRPGSAFIGLGAGFAISGCQTNISASALARVKRYPSGYFIAISDAAFAPAVGGEL